MLMEDVTDGDGPRRLVSRLGEAIVSKRAMMEVFSDRIGCTH